MSADHRGNPRRRLGAFGWGIVAGAALPVATPLAVWGALKLAMPDLKAPAFNVALVSAGADVSRHGGTRVILANERGAVTQSCREACDDLRVRQSSGDNSFWVRALDASGACVACTPAGIYVTNGYGASVTTFVVEGRQKLGVRYGEAP